ncbi:protein of unknown function [Xenorhabdus doucetiae]|uniref:Uncharacterized protein n=1 Tax=Xenorhabdus doucetiae TaxID=351671 RepID=A0A068QPT7_9GAMM|nr:protein of unknown function [Xenorhabdus doucetiae]
MISVVRNDWGRIIRPKAANAYPASAWDVIIRPSFINWE